MFKRYNLDIKKNFISMPTVSIIGAIVLALLLRVWGLEAGLPDVKIHIDENTMVNLALAIVPLKGALWTSGNGLLMPYILFFVFAVYYFFGVIFKQFSSPETFLIEYLKHPGNFTLIGRELNVFFGILTVWVIYKVTKDWFGQRIGLLSAWFLAVSFIHVKESHYIKNDVLVGLIVLLIFHFSCLIVSQKKLKNYLFAGLFVGLAFGVKFYPIISIITVLAAHFIKTVKQKNNFIDKKIILFLEIVLLTIIFQSAPTLIFKSDGLSEFIRIKNIVLYDIKPLTNEPLIITFLFRHLREGMGLLMFLTAMIGLLYSVLKIKQFQYFLLIFFPLFFLFTIDLWASYNLPRHSLVLLPFFIILSSLGVNLAIERLSSSNKIKLLVLVIISLTIMAPTLNRSIKMDRYFAGIDTRHLAKKWVEANIPSGEKIVIEGTLKPYIPGGAAPILLSEDAIQKQTVIAQENGYPGTTLKALSKANQSQLGYDILSSQRLDKELDIVMGVERDLNSSFFYYSQGYNYIVTLNWAHFYKPLDQNFDQDFKLNYQKVAQFKPDIDFTASPHDMEIQYEKLDMIDPFRDEMIVGPSIEIYKKLK